MYEGELCVKLSTGPWVPQQRKAVYLSVCLSNCQSSLPQTPPAPTHHRGGLSLGSGRIPRCEWTILPRDVIRNRC